MIRHRPAFRIFAICLLGCLALPVLTQASQTDNPELQQPAADLTHTYQALIEERAEQARINREREARFKEEQQQKQAQLNALKQDYLERKGELDQLKDSIAKTDQQIQDKQQALTERSHQLRDLFSAWKQVLKDSRALAQNSLISHQFPEQLAQLQALEKLPTLPVEEDLEALWRLLRQDIQQSGQHAQYRGMVALTNGNRVEQTIQRIGPFTAISQGQFLLHDAQRNSLSVAPKQPDTQFFGLKGEYDALTVIDPSRGVVLERLSLSPDWQERIQQGGYIGYAILLLGLAGLILAMVRGLFIAGTRRSIQQQLNNIEQIREDNPLGKIIRAYQQSLSGNQSGARQTESLEVKLQEIVLQEMPRLDKSIGLLKLLAAIAPLLGLLGTVVGMINTFQTITLVGNADPKLMAGGISQALMTTVLGLLVAVPLLFAHSYIAARARDVMIFLSQQSLGYIALSLDNTSTTQDTNRPQTKEPE